MILLAQRPQSSQRKIEVPCYLKIFLMDMKYDKEILLNH